MFACRALAVVTAVLLIAGCSGRRQATESLEKVDSATKQTAAKSEEKPEKTKYAVASGQINLRWQDGNKTTFSATASKAEGNEATETATLRDVSAELYRDGKKVSTLKAPKVTADRKTGKIVADGGAVITSLEQKTVLKAPKAVWLMKQHKVIATGGVTCVFGNGHIKSESLVADTELQSMEFGKLITLPDERNSGSPKK